MTTSKKNYSYTLYKIAKTKEAKLIKQLQAAGLSVAGRKTIKDTELTLYVLSDPIASVWWSAQYQEYFQKRPAPTNEIYSGVFIISDSKTCYAATMGNAYQYLKDLAEPNFGIKLAEHITNNSWKSQAVSSQTPNLKTHGPGEPIHHLSAQPTDIAWGSTITFGQSIHFNVPVKPDDLPKFIKKIENILIQPPSQMAGQPNELQPNIGDGEGVTLSASVETISITLSRNEST